MSQIFGDLVEQGTALKPPALTKHGNVIPCATHFDVPTNTSSRDSRGQSKHLYATNISPRPRPVDAAEGSTQHTARSTQHAAHELLSHAVKQ